jgi:hypothetical protein
MTTIKSLVKAVLSHDSINSQQFADIANHGADGGTASGFIYFEDTCEFFDKNEDLITDLITEVHADCYGEGSILEMLTSFGRGSDLEVEHVECTFYDDEYSEKVEFENDVVWVMDDFDNCRQKAIVKDRQYKNLMAWFALEEVSHHILALLEEGEVKTVEDYGIDCEEWVEFNA